MGINLGMTWFVSVLYPWDTSDSPTETPKRIIQGKTGYSLKCLAFVALNSLAPLKSLPGLGI